VKRESSIFHQSCCGKKKKKKRPEMESKGKGRLLRGERNPKGGTLVQGKGKTRGANQRKEKQGCAKKRLFRLERKRRMP